MKLIKIIFFLPFIFFAFNSYGSEASNWLNIEIDKIFKNSFVYVIFVYDFPGNLPASGVPYKHTKIIKIRVFRYLCMVRFQVNYQHFQTFKSARLNKTQRFMYTEVMYPVQF